MKKNVPINDKDLEKKAAIDVSSREELRLIAKATALYQAQRVMDVRKLDKNMEMETELANAAMSAFDTAFNAYIKNGKVTDENSNFSPYFGWWARQAIVSYLEKK